VFLSSIENQINGTGSHHQPTKLGDVVSAQPTQVKNEESRQGDTPLTATFQPLVFETLE
jgi:hypothetical protein